MNTLMEFADLFSDSADSRTYHHVDSHGHHVIRHMNGAVFNNQVNLGGHDVRIIVRRDLVDWWIILLLAFLLLLALLLLRWHIVCYIFTDYRLQQK
jgi:hypothetical protein